MISAQTPSVCREGKPIPTKPFVLQKNSDDRQVDLDSSSAFSPASPLAASTISACQTLSQIRPRKNDQNGPRQLKRKDLSIRADESRGTGVEPPPCGYATDCSGPHPHTATADPIFFSVNGEQISAAGFGSTGLNLVRPHYEPRRVLPLDLRVSSRFYGAQSPRLRGRAHSPPGEKP
jgi:hypothetical protein